MQQHKLRTRRTVLALIALVIFTIDIAFFLSFLGVGDVFGWDLAPSKARADAETYIRTKMEKCFEEGYSNKCYRTIAQDFLDHFTLNEVLTVFKENEMRPEFITHCHEVAHYLGRGEYEKVGDVKKVFPQCERTCVDGCYHGAVEGHFLAKNIPFDVSSPRVLEEIPVICGKQEEIYYGTCLHGLGHAMMILANHDLLQALELCDILEKRGDEEVCYSGAFMENVDSARAVNSPHPPKYAKIDDPIYPCPILDERYQKICYTYSVIQAFQSDLEKTIELCHQIPLEYQEECFRTMGRDRVLYADNAETIKDQCSLIPESAYKEACFSSAASYLVERYGITTEFPLELCLILDAPYQESCYRGFINQVLVYTKDSTILDPICRKITSEEYRDKCREWTQG